MPIRERLLLHVTIKKIIISGTFQAKLKEAEGNEIISITEGRFDLNLKTLN